MGAEGDTLEEHEYMRSLLGRWLRIDIPDGRTMIGKQILSDVLKRENISGRLLCVDSEPHIVIGSCKEYWLNSEGRLDEGTSPRVIGSAVIPKRHVKRICLLEKVDKQ